MSESLSYEGVEELPLDVILEVQSDVESTEDPPMEEWSSLATEYVELTAKRAAYEKGLYSPGSGEICTKYISMSDSSVFRHHYYTYPGVTDPGIKEALLDPEEPVVYPTDGQERYMATCKEMNECPVSLFYNGLLQERINLSYYCVHPPGIRAMAEALKYNDIVKSFNLTDNFLTPDACFHLGEMFKTNYTLQELNLSGCQIGPAGLLRLTDGLLRNKALQVLNLNKNSLTDEGGEHLAKAILELFDVRQLHLSYNRLGHKTATALAEVLDIFNTISHLDLSWNNFFSPVGTFTMLSRLQENNNLQELNLSWNSMSGPRLATAIKNVLLAPNLQHLNLSNNNFSGDAIDIITENLKKAKKLHVFNLSFNPLTVEDANKVMIKVKFVHVKVQELYLDNIDVDMNFLMTLDRMKKMKSKKHVIVTYGNVVGTRIVNGPDPRQLVLKRAEYLAQSAKRNKANIALIFLQMLKDGITVTELKSFQDYLKSHGAGMLDDDLTEEIVNVFPGPRSKKTKMINVVKLGDYVKRLWPDQQLPPEPTLVSEPVKAVEGKGKKGKKGIKK